MLLLFMRWNQQNRPSDSGMAGKSASLAKVAGKIPNANLSKVAGSSKVDVAAIVKKHNAFEGIKRGMGEFVQDVKGGMQVAGGSNRLAVGANGVSGNSLGRVNDVAESGVSNRAVVDSIVRIKTEVERVDGGNRTGNRLAGDSEITPFVGKGEQYTNGRKNRLKPNIRYQTGEYDYFYETDDAGRITKFETDNLQLTTRVNRLSHSRNTLGKIKGKDHAGHLAGDRFGGSPKLDNLVSQLSDVNLKQYKKIEDEWAVALNDIPPKKVTVDVEISYEEIDLRPKTFIVNYTIDGKSGFKIIEN
jgi:DNA/RNA non-specific endonuclease